MTTIYHYFDEYILNNFYRDTESCASNITSRAERLAFKIASYLTDPVCRAHETFCYIYVIDALNLQKSELSKTIKKTMCIGSMIFYGSVALFTTLCGFGARGLAIYLQKEPFIHLESSHVGVKTLESDSFTLLSWNICCVGAGYSISDGGVMPWRNRIDHLSKKIIEADADVNCLYETFDYGSADFLAEKLQGAGYPHIYYNIRPRILGVNSGILVASKFKIENPEFTIFSQESLIGRTKNASKGVFGFDLVSQENAFVRIYATHLQHSELPEFPTEEEVSARGMQMQQIINKVNQVKDRAIILTGDLNLDEDEYKNSFWQKKFNWIQPEEFSKKSWGGDSFCAEMVGKKQSSSLNLDYTIVLEGTAIEGKTSYIETNFDGEVFKEEALSDHLGLFTQITLKI